MYLSSFTLPLEREDELAERRMRHNGGCFGYLDNPYPCGLFTQRGPEEIRFRPVTIFYGGNGSGKSTLLNLIAEKLRLGRLAPFNSGELFASYAEACGYTLDTDDEGEGREIPEGSRIITSDDVFDYMLAVRTNNGEIAEETEKGREEYARQKFGETVRLSGMEDYEKLRTQVLARRRSVSRRAFLRKIVGSQVRMGSNGETALAYFENALENDTLYCLDEPENSLSPRMQLELKEMLEKMVRYCGCQFILSTHSPFLLSLEGARIYDLDASPVRERNWWELENVRVWFDFFEKNRELLEKGGRR